MRRFDSAVVPSYKIVPAHRYGLGFFADGLARILGTSIPCISRLYETIDSINQLLQAYRSTYGRI